MLQSREFNKNYFDDHYDQGSTEQNGVVSDQSVRSGPRNSKPGSWPLQAKNGNAGQDLALKNYQNLKADRTRPTKFENQGQRKNSNFRTEPGPAKFWTNSDRSVSGFQIMRENFSALKSCCLSKSAETQIRLDIGVEIWQKIAKSQYSMENIDGHIGHFGRLDMKCSNLATKLKNIRHIWHFESDLKM